MHSNKDDSAKGISQKDLERYYRYPQPEAAKRLGVSLGALKKRFYEISRGARWPYARIKKIMRKGKINYVLNTSEKDPRYLDPFTVNALKKAFKQNTASQH